MHSYELNQVAYVLPETGSSSYVQQVEEICLFSMRADRKDERIRIRMRPKKFMDDRYGLMFIAKALSQKKSISSPNYYWENNSYPPRKFYNLWFLVFDGKFKESPKETEGDAGSEVQLTCGPPSGFPKPEVTWYKDDQLVTPDNRRIRNEIMSNGKVIFEEFMKYFFWINALLTLNF